MSTPTPGPADGYTPAPPSSVEDLPPASPSSAYQPIGGIPSYGQSAPAPEPAPAYGSLHAAPPVNGFDPGDGSYDIVPSTPAVNPAVTGYGSSLSGMYGRPPLASWGKRVQAGLVDWVLPFIGGGIITGIGGLIAGIGSGTAGTGGPISDHGLLPSIIGVGLVAIGSIFALLFMIINSWIRQGNTGQSLGKSWAGIRLIKESTGQVPGIGLTIGRYFCHLIDSAICYIGWLFPLFTEKKQTIADMIAGTVVIVDQS